MEYYEKLYHYTIEQLCQERKQHENEIIEATVKQIVAQPLKPNSVYIVKFQEGATLDNVNQVIRHLNERTKEKDITFIPSCDYFQIIGDSIE